MRSSRAASSRLVSRLPRSRPLPSSTRHARHRQALGGQPSHGRCRASAEVPAAGALPEQHLGSEVVALGVGQAEQPVHADGTLLVQQHTHRAGASAAAGRHQGDGGVPPWRLSLLESRALQAAGRIGHRHVEGIAGERQPRDRGSVGLNAIVPVPALGPPALGRFLHRAERARGGGPLAAAGAEGELGEALQLGQSRGRGRPHR
jgi:hypothetical protein